MENFEDFKIGNQEMIFGGELIPTCPTNGDKDLYDTKNKRLIYEVA